MCYYDHEKLGILTSGVGRSNLANHLENVMIYLLQKENYGQLLQDCNELRFGGAFTFHLLV